MMTVQQDKANPAALSSKPKRPVSLRVNDNWQMYCFLAIPLAWLIIFKYVPMYGATIAFKRYDFSVGILGSPWVGLANFEKFFKSYQLERVVGNTL